MIVHCVQLHHLLGKTETLRHTPLKRAAAANLFSVIRHSVKFCVIFEVEGVCATNASPTVLLLMLLRQAVVVVQGETWGIIGALISRICPKDRSQLEPSFLAEAIMLQKKRGGTSDYNGPFQRSDTNCKFHHGSFDLGQLCGLLCHTYGIWDFSSLGKIGSLRFAVVLVRLWYKTHKLRRLVRKVSCPQNNLLQLLLETLERVYHGYYQQYNMY